LENDGMKCETQKEIKIYYDGLAQVISYLKATGLEVGLLLNFAKPTLKVKRVVA